MKHSYEMPSKLRWQKLVFERAKSKSLLRWMVPILLLGISFTSKGQTTEFTYTGNVQTYTVPAGVTRIKVEAWGAQGGTAANNAPRCPNMGGLGGYAAGELSVTPGQVLSVYVGGKGTAGNNGGFNGGGRGGSDANTTATGGGASDVRAGAGSLTDRLIVAGGGGAAEWAGGCGIAGAGGGLTGGTGPGDSPANSGGGGTQTTGGIAGPGGGSPGALGLGGNAIINHSGAGGGGWYGGGSGGSNGHGGGGSSYIGGVLNGSTQSGVRSGDGSVKIIVLTSTYYQDSDGDGYGNSAVSVTGLTPPTGYVLRGGDCNDNDPTINPGATDLCDGIDRNCDGVVLTRPTGVLSGGNTTCAGQATTLTFTLTGTAPWSITYTNGTTPVTVNGILTSPYTVSVNPTATTTYSLTAVSDARCEATSFTGSATVTVNGAASITAPENITASTEAGKAGATVSFEATATGTPAPTITYTINGVTVASPYFFPVGTTTVTATATNSCNADSKTFTVTVNDTEKPTITATNLTVNTDADRCDALLTIPALTLNDNSGSVGYIETFENFTLGNISGQNNVWAAWPNGPLSSQVSSAQANSGQKSLKVEGGHNEDQLFFMGDQTSGIWTIKFKMFIPAGSKGYYNIQHAEEPGLEWAQEVHFNADGTGDLYVGNSVQFSYPQNQWFEVSQTVNLDTDQATISINGVVVTTWQFSNNEMGEPGIKKLGSIDFYPMDETTLFYVDDLALYGTPTEMGQYVARTLSKSYPTGKTTATVSISDPSGNTEAVSFDVTVEDKQAPVAIAKNITVQLDATGNATITAEQVNNNSTDNCGIATIALDKTSFTCANVGANTVTLTVTDNSGNTHTATATVTVEDKVAPVAIAKNITVQLTAAGTVTIAAADIDNNSTDNCGVANLALSKTSFDCSNVGANTVTLTVTDAHGNASTATATVTVEDKINPTITAPAAVTVTVDPGKTTASNVTLGTPVTADNCSVATATNNAPATFPTGNTTVTWTVTDASGNTATATQIVTVKPNAVSAARPATLEVPIRTTFANVNKPATVAVTFTDGNAVQVPVTWQQGTYNRLESGDYEITGTLTMPADRSNVNNVDVKWTVRVMPNQAPTNITLSKSSFQPSIGPDQAIGTLTTTDVDDPIDNQPENQHLYELVTGAGSTDNVLFEIDGNQLFLKSNKGLSGKTSFSIRVRTVDPYNNTFEKTFTLTKEGYNVATVDLKIVNAFSPNGDGVNDTWTVPELKFYNNVEVQVFDRAGVRLFHTTNPEQGWNGRNQHGDVLAGPYLYIIHVKDINYVKKGTVTILKK